MVCFLQFFIWISFRSASTSSAPVPRQDREQRFSEYHAPLFADEEATKFKTLPFLQMHKEIADQFNPGICTTDNKVLGGLALAVGAGATAIDYYSTKKEDRNFKKSMGTGLVHGAASFAGGKVGLALADKGSSSPGNKIGETGFGKVIGLAESTEDRTESILEKVKEMLA